MRIRVDGIKAANAGLAVIGGWGGEESGEQRADLVNWEL